jgi:hypothetical protein
MHAFHDHFPGKSVKPKKNMKTHNQINAAVMVVALAGAAACAKADILTVLDTQYSISLGRNNGLFQNSSPPPSETGWTFNPSSGAWIHPFQIDQTSSGSLMWPGNVTGLSADESLFARWWNDGLGTFYPQFADLPAGFFVSATGTVSPNQYISQSVSLATAWLGDVASEITFVANATVRADLALHGSVSSVGLLGEHVILTDLTTGDRLFSWNGNLPNPIAASEDIELKEGHVYQSLGVISPIASEYGFANWTLTVPEGGNSLLLLGTTMGLIGLGRRSRGNSMKSNENQGNEQ